MEYVLSVPVIRASNSLAPVEKGTTEITQSARWKTSVTYGSELITFPSEVFWQVPGKEQLNLI